LVECNIQLENKMQKELQKISKSIK